MRRVALGMAANSTSLHATAAALARAQSLPALVGFDGFTDAILHAVSTRASMRVDDFARIATITEFSQRIAAAAGKSTNVELVRHELRFGGNGPLMASGLAGLGARVTYIGAIAKHDDHAAIDPIFAGFVSRCSRAIAIGLPGHTDALEFSDGKIMFNHTAAVQSVTWDAIVARVGLPTLREMVAESALLGIVNWSLLGGVPSIWQGLMRDVLPQVGARTRLVNSEARRMFIDLSDPAKRTDADIAAMLAQLHELDKHVHVTLGLNLAEAQRIAAVLRVYDNEAQPLEARLPGLAHRIREQANITSVVIHPREGAAASTRDIAQAHYVPGPVTANPKLSTGAGDHFNAGFAFAQTLGLSQEQCLAVAVATSGAYVRDAQSPSRERVIEMLKLGW